MINIVCTSKPCDGLFYYSYEYCSLLNQIGINANVVIISHRNFTCDDYLNAIKEKYIMCENLVLNRYNPSKSDISLIMGRSMMTLSYQDFDLYSKTQQESLKKLFSNNVIAVYSENHPYKYPKALEFYSPKNVFDLCDHEVYSNGLGRHFEKTINFDIHKEPENDIEFEYLFLGTNEKYYKTVQSVIEQYQDHGIITYNENYIDPKNNNIFAPVNNLLGKFKTFVYTKDTFDPAPRIVQECKYFNKDSIYSRDKSLHDGGSVYWNRPIRKPDLQPIINTIEEIV